DPKELTPAIRREVAQLDSDLPVSRVATMEEVIAESIWQPRLYATLFAVFAGGALLLALGGTARDVFKLIVGRGMKLTVIGVVIGIAGAVALTRLMHSLLFNTSAT